MPFVDSSELPGGEPLPGWVGRFVHADNLTFADYEIAPDAASLHEHSHLQEEVGIVADGQLAITIDGVERVVGAGCAAIVPANTPHSAQVLAACRALVVDYPPRDHVGGVRTAG